ncbi:Dak1 domain-containing protein [Podospora australis]|uniref:3-hydroxyisobutyryl-coenzyme A hydrolase n=1 Tax=Podospora australis TaxID=1536484 RepID=A0AAN7AGJ9_9PEZI|nr:Dak1 domain-containing protein [Podospora australis]
MSNRHFINDPVHLVTTALQSLTYTNPGLALDLPNKIIYRRPGYGSSPQRVAIISGGGSGHEPSFAGMVGPGLLSAAVAGTIFASPSAEQIRTAIMARVDHGDDQGGVLVTVMNYTGDVLNFGIGVEKAKAAGVNVEMVVVGDDVGVGRAKAGKVGRRGIAGTVLVHKISGALAAQGRSLKEVAKVARLVADNLVSVGASLEHVHVPGRKLVDSEGLKEGEVEIGMGIHNEAGSGREVVELPGLVQKMLKQMLDKNDKDRAFVNVNSNEVVLLINNLGGVSVLEMGGIVAEVVTQLEKDYNIRPARILNGTYMTSLNGLGFSITLLNVVNTEIGGPSMIQLLDEPSEATGWTPSVSKRTWEEKNSQTREQDASVGADMQSSGLQMDAKAAQQALTKALDSVVAAESEVTRYDTIVGDGDCGIGLKRGAEAVLKHLKAKPLSGDAVLDVTSIVPVIEREMDGTSGALYAIFLNALVGALRSESKKENEASPKVWAAALRQSCEALSKYTPARPGDRTLVDALYPFVDVLEKSGDVKEAAEAAVKAAEGTKGMKASLGRTVYIGGSGFEEVPDPGAWGLASFFSGLAGISKGDEGWEKLPHEDDDPEDVLFSSLYGLRTIQLNRPKKYNVVNGSMIRKIAPRLIEWSKSDMANVIVMKGTGDKAFCSGGDVRELVQWNEAGKAHKSKAFFDKEYKLNHLIASLEKPYVAFMDGITMGGGVGLSVHAPLRIATERTEFAMPETKIGFFPDVGASFFLPRMPGYTGTYLALTGDSLKGANVFYAGIATHYLHSTSLPALESRLAELRFGDFDPLKTRLATISATIEEFVTGLPYNEPIALSGEIRKAIDRCFCFDTVPEILRALEAESGNPATQKWAQNTLQQLHERSPISIHVALRLMRVGAHWNIAQAFRREHGIACKFMDPSTGSEFNEGVSAKLVSKPARAANWSTTLEQITPEQSSKIVETFFKPNKDDKPLQLIADGEFDEYPFGYFGVPTEKEVEDVVAQGNKLTRAGIVQHFLTERRQKQGVKEVVEEIWSRKTAAHEDGSVTWIYQ